MNASAGLPLRVRRWLRSLYYGWVMVFALSVTTATSFGALYYSFSVFVTPLEDEFGWSRAAITGAFSAATLISGLAGLVIGRITDRFGPRLVMTFGSVLATGGLALFALVGSLPLFYLAWAGVLALAMATTFYSPAFVAVANWFQRKRGRAMAVLTFGGGFASVIFFPLTSWLIASFGWRTAAVALAVIVLAVTLPPHLLLLRRRPSDLGLHADGEPPSDGSPAVTAMVSDGWTVRDALRHYGFFLMVMGALTGGIAMSVTTVHLVPLLQSEGWSAAAAGGIAGLVGLVALPGRIFLNILGDRVSRAIVLAAITLTQALAMLPLLMMGSGAGAYLFVALYGWGFGAITPLRATLVADYFGTRHYGSILALQGFLTSLAGAGGPLMAGWLYDRTGGYDLVLMLLGALLITSCVAVIAADRALHRPQAAVASALP